MLTGDTAECGPTLRDYAERRDWRGIQLFGWITPVSQRHPLNDDFTSARSNLQIRQGLFYRATSN